MKKECIILAGGMGTRLKDTIGSIPKCLAPVNGKPFLAYLMKYLTDQGITDVVLALGYLHEQVIDFAENNSLLLSVKWVVEQEPLGTGGGIRLATMLCETEDILVVNGDTYFDIPMMDFLNFHKGKSADVSLALRHMKDFDRYGIVHFDEEQRINSFSEKQPAKEGYINGGVYCLNRTSFLEHTSAGCFSMEKDYLEKLLTDIRVYGYISDGYFTDIGIPEDFALAQEIFKTL